jgi:hypothetical protein
MFKLKTYLDSISEGSMPGKLAFRQGDHFLEIADSVYLAISKIKENHLKDFIYLSEINSYLNNLTLVIPEDKKAVLMEITSKLTEIQERLKG